MAREDPPSPAGSARPSSARVLGAFAVLFVATLVVTMAGSAPLYAGGHGVERSVGPVGVAVFAVVTPVIGVLSWAILTRLAQVPASSLGFARPTAGTLARVLAGFATGGALVMSSVLFGLVRAPAQQHPSTSALAIGLLALALSAIAQQWMVAAWVRCLLQRFPLPLALALPVLLFTLLHLADGPGALVLVNTALWGLMATLLVFRDPPTPRFPIAIGLHTAWNFTLVFVVGSPVNGQPPPWGYFSWPEAAGWLGGKNGFDGGLWCTVLLLAGVAIARLARRRSGALP